ncbi:translocation/assembly module TamB domain-containing protein [Microvirga mediterraneensis]|uniref:Translocation/assembly module TamB domain-containing protein n=1 Tax=Microvirga mediterraneensis TaxID=2754695 RepID=A0A838BMX5_9HYPH|nr:translocation/assembly module TamB domain-containing protein [Microvirga mediterraneensis]MBA1156429.1 translocation/assembly module TamB domain-containing protein [Microvirga mediterraneensis]
MLKPIRSLVLMSIVVLAVAAFWLASDRPSQAQSDQGILASLISRLLSTPTTRVTIGSIEGALTSDAVIRDIRIADRDGVWLNLDRARLVWSRTALLRGRLQVDELTIDKLRIARRPLPAEEGAPVSDEPILPELPVKVVVDRFALQELALGQPVLGTEARLSAAGSAQLGDPSEGLDVNFQAQRLDAPGKLSIDLTYVPQTKRLALDLTHQEPAGGIAARLMDLPGLPPVDLKVTGQGPMSDFAARLDFTAGPTIGAAGTATVRRATAAYDVNLDLAARIEGLLPAPAAPVFSGTTQLVGNVTVGDDSSLRFQPVRITSNVARFDMTGTVSSGQVLDLALNARALPTDGAKTRAGAAEIARLNFDGTVQGPLTAPRINGSLDAAEIRLPEGSLDTLTARLAMNPADGATPPSQFSFSIDANAAGIRPSDRALARAIGPTLSIASRGSFGLDGIANVETARIETSTAQASFTGRLGGTVLDGTLDARIPALASFSGLAGRPLQGAATLTAQLSGNPRRYDMAAVIDARLRELSTGAPAVDGLLGRSVTAAGTLRRIPNGYAFENLRVDGTHLDARIDGRATQFAADLGLDITINELRRVDPRITGGRANVTARLGGSLEKPDVKGVATLTDVRALNRSIPRLAINVDAKDVTGALDAALTLDGRVDGKPATGSLHLARPADGGWLLDRLAVDIGSVALKGALRLDANQLAQGDISLSGSNFDDLSPLVLTKLDGALDAVVSLSARDGGQDARITAKGARFAAADVSVRDFDARLTLQDLYRRPMIDGTISAEPLTAAGQTYRAVRFVANGTPAASQFTASAVGQGFNLDAQGRVVPGDATRIELATFTARRGNRRLALAQPAAITLQNGAVTLSNLVIAADQGRVTVNGTVADRLDLTVDVRSLPLQAADILVPNLGLAGTVNGNATIGGTAANPTGSYRVAVSGLATAETRRAGLPALSIEAQGRLADQRAGLDARIAIGRGGTLQVAGSVPLSPAEELALRVSGRTDLTIANSFLSASGQRLTGAANLDLSIAGTFANPRVEGNVTLANGSFTDSLQGIRLNGIAGRFVARGQVLTIENLSAQTPSGGSLAARGQVTIDPAAGLPGEIRITGNRAQLVSNETVDATADLDLTLSGPLMSRPRAAGRINIVSMNVSVPDRLPTTLRPLPGTKHVRPTPTAAARLALAQRRQSASARGTPFRAELDLTLTAQNRIFVRGRGINAELGGDLRLQGTTQDPVAIGAFELRRGRFDILGKRLDFVRGRLDFTGDLTPSLDFLAETQAGDVTARIGVTGPASSPEFTFSSSPDLPQDEVLSRILFQRPSGGLSAGQALQLAQAVAQLSGGSGNDAFEQLRRSLGVDSLDITVGADGGPGVGVSRYISDNVRVGVKAGAQPEESGVTVDIDLTRRLKAQGEINAEGGSSVGLGFELEY